MPPLQKRTVAAWASLVLILFDLAAETSRLAYCLSHPEESQTAACRDPAGPLTAALVELRRWQSGETETAPAPPASPPPAPAAPSKLDQMRRNPGL